MTRIKFLKKIMSIITVLTVVILFINITYATQINGSATPKPTQQTDSDTNSSSSSAGGETANGAGNINVQPTTDQSAQNNSSQVQSNTQINTSPTNSNELNLYSKSSILIDSTTGQILYEHNAYEKLYPASTTKLMTAILTLENCQLTDTVTVNPDALKGIPATYTTAALQPNEQLTVDQLLHVLLIPSANDAANVLAYHVAGSIENFAVMMNAKAKEIGCKNTHFVNPSGVHNDEHYSTAYDMALIGKFANTFDTVKDIVTQTQYSLPDLPDGKKRNFKTTNTLITPNNKYYYEYATGLKTGYTDKAKSCIVAKAKKDDTELICAVLYGEKTEDKKNERELDCHTLFDYGFNNYKETTICEKDQSINTDSIDNVPEIYENTDVLYEDDLNLLVNQNSNSNIESNISWNTDLKYPISKDTVIGNVTYIIDGNNYSVNLIAGENILPTNSESISNIFYILVGILLIILLITIFTKKRKNRYHKKSRSSKDEKYFRHSFY